MFKFLPGLLIVCFFVLHTSCNTTTESNKPSLFDSCYALKPLSSIKPEAQEWEWKAMHPEELQVPVKTYIYDKPPRANGKRQKLYTVKLGSFDRTGNEIYLIVRAYLQSFFQIEVDTLKTISVQEIPAGASRQNEYGKQLQTHYILDSILSVHKPDDAYAVIAFSLYDLYPDDRWNYVFGQASLNQGVGVWSMARFGNYRESKAAYTLSLLRTMQVAAHETGHMLGITHCVQYACCMNGSNSLQESDAQPQWLCWECMAKVCWNRNINVASHIKALYLFHHRYTRNADCISYYGKALTLLKPKANQ